MIKEMDADLGAVKAVFCGQMVPDDLLIKEMEQVGRI